MQRLLLSSIGELCSNYFNFMSDCVLDFPKVIWCQGGFHSSLLPIASEGRPDVHFFFQADEICNIVKRCHCCLDLVGKA